MKSLISAAILSTVALTNAALPSKVYASSTVNTHISSHSQYDFSSLADGIRIVNQLKMGISPSEQAWQQLFSHNAYQLVFSISDLTQEKLKNRFEIAFLPMKAVHFDALNAFEKQEVKHLRTALYNLDWINEYKNMLTGSDAVERSLALANQWIPKAFQSKQATQYVFGFFGQNAHASAVGVVLDPYLGYLSDLHAPFELGAHELHHNLRAKIKLAKPLDRGNGFDRAIDHLQHEGVANLIDKSRFLEAQSPFSDEIKNYFASELKKAPNYVIALNKVMSEAASDHENADFMAFQKVGLPLWGHVVGWYMTQTIVKAGMKEQLVESMVTPRAFPHLYNQAVERLGTQQPQFSQSVIDVYRQRATLSL